MKTILTVVVVVVVLIAAVVFLFPWGKEYAGQKRDDVDKTFRNQVSDSRVVERAGEKLGTARAQVRDNYIKVAEVKQQLANQQETMTSKSQQLAKEEANVTQAMAWLESHQSGDVLHKSDQTFSFDVVAKDARLRTQNCQNLRTAIKGLQESCQLMGTKVNEAQAAIRNSLSTIREKEGALEAKKAELAALRSVEQAVAIARGLNFEGVNGEISGRFIKELDRRITTAKAGMEFEQVESFSTGIVPWESEDVQSDLNFVRAYQRQNMGRSDQPENVTPPAPLISEDLSGAISDVTQ